MLGPFVGKSCRLFGGIRYVGQLVPFGYYTDWMLSMENAPNERAYKQPVSED